MLDSDQVIIPYDKIKYASQGSACFCILPDGPSHSYLEAQNVLPMAIHLTAPSLWIAITAVLPPQCMATKAVTYYWNGFRIYIREGKT